MQTLPIMILHGDKDPIVPLKQAQSFYRIGQQLGFKINIEAIQTADHFGPMKEPEGVGHLKRFLHQCHNHAIRFSEDNSLITTQRIELGDILAQVSSKESRRYIKIDTVVVIAVEDNEYEVKKRAKEKTKTTI